MSQEACNQFFALVNADPALQQEVNTALEGKEGEDTAKAFVWVGAKHGYEFTAAEATQKYQEILAAGDGELDEEALEQVVGNAGPNAKFGVGGVFRPGRALFYENDRAFISNDRAMNLAGANQGGGGVYVIKFFQFES